MAVKVYKDVREQLVGPLVLEDYLSTGWKLTKEEAMAEPEKVEEKIIKITLDKPKPKAKAKRGPGRPRKKKS